jgi:hypothetical protein
MEDMTEYSSNMIGHLMGNTAQIPAKLKTIVSLRLSAQDIP